MIWGDSDIIRILLRGRQEGCSQKMKSGGRKDAILLALMMEDEATGQGPQVPPEAGKGGKQVREVS